MGDLETQLNNAKERDSHHQQRTLFLVIDMLTHLLVYHLQDPPLMDPLTLSLLRLKSLCNELSVVQILFVPHQSISFLLVYSSGVNPKW